MSYRTGIGYDIHRLVVGRKLILAGVPIAHPRGLLGHSDGDVVLHAVCDALLGACAMGDIGVMFPDTSPDTRDMDSLVMLRQVIERIAPVHRVVNIDVNCICERPKLSPFREKMVANIAEACKIDASAVSVKFRTHEGLGEIGSGEAIAAQAVVLLEKAD
ncbi:MAG TPA: 2-C-methyl-D-erythritol 2,4-cyclodiphosphate synthase [Deltaproteobacteria bacterium]|jgi:2-C-methyl-D-erythritol 2,4-cyclodiphosphate synthase|nr:2-C-methyl-D-erythritol 2,4-cyclodiphosphate synthase [Deltaproteobacteria bacterium]HOI06045.1 2-C-methyl-D-erythritol 2,4-cyclodiphosphate synthase [Deltaproteobacteria bacterium]